jgi:hypothetical protein
MAVAARVKCRVGSHHGISAQYTVRNQKQCAFFRVRHHTDDAHASRVQWSREKGKKFRLVSVAEGVSDIKRILQGIQVRMKDYISCVSCRLGMNIKSPLSLWMSRSPRIHHRPNYRWNLPHPDAE